MAALKHEVCFSWRGLSSLWVRNNCDRMQLFVGDIEDALADDMPLISVATVGLVLWAR